MSKPKPGDPVWDRAAEGLCHLLALFSKPYALRNLDKKTLLVLRNSIFEFVSHAAPYLVYRKQQSPLGAHAKRRR